MARRIAYHFVDFLGCLVFNVVMYVVFGAGVVLIIFLSCLFSRMWAHVMGGLYKEA